MNIGIITGASSGLGREFALRAKRHYKDLDELWLIARRTERLENLRKKISIPIKVISLDLTKEEAFSELETKLKEAAPKVSLLVNAAGYGKIGKVGEVHIKDETGMIRLNCEALIGITNIVLPFIKEGGHIVNFASSAAFMPQPKFAIYSATKSLILSYSRALREELKPRQISVTAVCPGPVKTEFFDIAESKEEIPLIKRLTMANAKDVIKLAIRDNLAGKAISVYGIVMKSFYVLAKVVPHRILITGYSYLNK